MDEKEFKRHYPNAKGFLLSFMEQSYISISDDEIIDDYFQIQYIDHYKEQVLPQAYEVLKLEPFPEDAIECITNRWNPNKSRKAWFVEIVHKLEKKIEEAEGKQGK